MISSILTSSTAMSASSASIRASIVPSRKPWCSVKFPGALATTTAGPSPRTPTETANQQFRRPVSRLTSTMACMDDLEHSDAVFVAASPQALYEMVSDVTRMGDWSPICKACWWDDDGPRVGAWFTGRNVTPERSWETRSQVVVANPGREFAFQLRGSWTRWGRLHLRTGRRRDPPYGVVALPARCRRWLPRALR